MNLYFIRWDNEDGENQDALVEAKSKEHALTIWCDEFELDWEQMPDWIGEVRQTGAARMIPWDEINPES